MPKMKSISPVCACIVLLLAAVPGEASENLTFEEHVRPILKTYCFDCHGGEKTRGGLDLRLKRFAEKGGDKGPSIVPGHPEKSSLYGRVKSGEMPKGEKKVPADKIAIL